MSTLCIDYNFKIHHNDGNNVSLYQWLREDMEDMVVPSATSHLACGSIVINQGRILLIEEKGVRSV